MARSLDVFGSPVDSTDDDSEHGARRDRAALIALLKRRPHRMSTPEIVAEVSAEGSATSVWNRFAGSTLFGEDPAVEEAAACLSEWHAQGIGVVAFLGSTYPVALREVREMPPVLFYRGKLRREDRAVCVVGSRTASERGRSVATTVARNLAERDVTVASGLAKGIDTAAHIGALEAGGRTVACIGTGVMEYYPPENRALQDRIARDGLVFSQFWPGTSPRRQNFPMRNAVMSGYGRATIIVEAGERSGARLQAKQAVAHGRPVILLDSVVEATQWGKNLIDRPGVWVVSSMRETMDVVEDVLDGSHSVEAQLAHLRSWRGE